MMVDNPSPLGPAWPTEPVTPETGLNMPPQSYVKLKWLAGVLMVTGLAGWISVSVGWGQLLKPWRELPAPLLAWLVSLVALSYLTRAQRLYELYRDRLPAGYASYLRINVIHTTMLNLLPMRSGEAVFPLLMKRHFGEAYASSLVRLLWLRVADLWVLLWIGVLAFAVAGEPRLWWLVAVGALPPLLVHPLRARLLSATAHGRRRWQRLLRRLLEGLPDRFGRYLRLLGWTLATWALKLIAFISVTHLLTDGPVGSLIPGIVAAEISSALPVHGIAGFGSYEGAMVLGAAWSGLPAPLLLAAAFNLHLFILACTLLFGALALLLPVRRSRVLGDN